MGAEAGQGVGFICPDSYRVHVKAEMMDVRTGQFAAGKDVEREEKKTKGTGHSLFL